MPEYTTLSRTTGATVLTLVAMACAAGLADALRRRRGRMRERTREHLEAAPRHTPHGTPVIPRQQRTGPQVEAVRLTPAERDAFAVLVRRLSEGN
jgi:Tfp pilus assembly protein PilP